ncbi:hypothetical protein CHH91_18120 [Virgibacillus sp. 7505]|nr:hypothetical protein CHH91_18120 [Virgibacillus sp. 7505]
MALFMELTHFDVFVFGCRVQFNGNMNKPELDAAFPNCMHDFTSLLLYGASAINITGKVWLLYS